MISHTSALLYQPIIAKNEAIVIPNQNLNIMRSSQVLTQAILKTCG